MEAFNRRRLPTAECSTWEAAFRRPNPLKDQGQKLPEALGGNAKKMEAKKR